MGKKINKKEIYDLEKILISTKNIKQFQMIKNLKENGLLPPPTSGNLLYGPDLMLLTKRTRQNEC